MSLQSSSKAAQKIEQVLIIGGTHGNEMSGIAAVKHWQTTYEQISALAPSTNVSLTLANEEAIARRVRYLEEDLNRQFSQQKLAIPITDESAKEAKIAHAFNKQFGPKGKSKSDFAIDIHNTTSNMGPTLIILQNDFFHQQLARFVKNQMPECRILIEDYQHFEQFAYLCTVAKKGVMVEVGPQVQGALKASVYQQTVNLTLAILKFIERYNTNTLPILEPVEAFRLGTEISYPTDTNNQKTAMIHPSIEGKDFLALTPKQPCFIDFEGADILWEGELTYPHFIGEAAYDHLNLAFATSTKCWF